MQLKAIRPFLFGILVVSVVITAQTPAKGPVSMRYTATTDNVNGAGDAVKINLLGWSSDADRDSLLAAWTLTAAAPAAGDRGSPPRNLCGRCW